MKKFEFTWSRFLSAAMCGAVLLFAGCEQTNPEKDPTQDPTTDPQEEVFAIEFSTEATEYGDFTVTAPEGTTSFYLYVSDMTAWGTTVEEEKALFLEELAGDNASAYLVEVEEFPYSTSIAQVLNANPMMMPMPLNPGDTYVVMVAPVEEPEAEDVVSETYTHEDPEAVDYTLGETAADVSFSGESVTATSISVTITPSEGASFFFEWMSKYDYEEQSTDDAKLEWMSKWESYTTAYDEVHNEDPKTEVYLVVYVFDSNNVGKIVSKRYEPEALSYSAVTMNAEVVSANMSDAVVSITPTGGDITSFSYYVAGVNTYSTPEDIKAAMETNTWYEATTVTAEEFTTNNQYLIERLDIFSVSTLYVVGFDSDNKPTHAISLTVDTSAAFKYEDSSEAPSVTAVTYTIGELSSYDDNGNLVYTPKTDLTWSSLSELTSFDELVMTETDENGNTVKLAWAKSGGYHLELNWGSIVPNNVWIACSANFDAPLTGEVKRADTQQVVKKVLENISYGMYDMASAKEGYTSQMDLCKVNTQYNEATYMDEFVSSSAPVIYIAYDDAEGTIYPCVTVDLNNYLKK